MHAFAPLHRIAQAVGELSAISKAVLSELRRSLHVSFLSAGDESVKVKASEIPFASPVDLLSDEESARDAGEMAFDDAVLKKQVDFVKSLNAIISASLR